MRLGTASVDGSPLTVMERDRALHPLRVAPGCTLVDLIRAGGEAVADAVERAGAPLSGARLVAPLRPGKIVAIGLNYLDRVRETGMERPDRPLVFAKFPSSVIGPTSRSSSISSPRLGGLRDVPTGAAHLRSILWAPWTMSARIWPAVRRPW